MRLILTRLARRGTLPLGSKLIEVDGGVTDGVARRALPARSHLVGFRAFGRSAAIRNLRDAALLDPGHGAASEGSADDGPMREKGSR